MEEYKSNSHASKRKAQEERERAQKVISGKAVIKKKNPVRKFTDIFVAEDFNNVKDYVWNDLVVPTIKNLLTNTIKDTADMMINGRSTRDSGRSGLGFRGDYISYNKYSDRDRFRSDRDSDRQRNRVLGYEDIVVNTRGDAEKVLDYLDDIIARYGIARVADLYEAVGLTGSHTDNKYGWSNLRNAEIVRGRDGYGFRMPKAMPID